MVDQGWVKTRDRRSECSSQRLFHHTLIITWRSRHYKCVGPPPAQYGSTKNLWSQNAAEIQISEMYSRHGCRKNATDTCLIMLIDERPSHLNWEERFFTHTHTQWSKCTLLQHHWSERQPMLARALVSRWVLVSQIRANPCEFGKLNHDRVEVWVHQSSNFQKLWFWLWCYDILKDHIGSPLQPKPHFYLQWHSGWVPLIPKDSSKHTTFASKSTCFPLQKHR